jgi:hypothetical protein
MRLLLAPCTATELSPSALAIHTNAGEYSRLLKVIL